MSYRIGRSAAWSTLVAAMLAASVPALAQTYPNPANVPNPDSGVTPATLPNTQALPTGKVITPAPQANPKTTPQPVGSFPSNMVLTPDGKFALVTDIGFREYLTCLSTATGQIANPLTVPATDAGGNTTSPPTSLSLINFGTPYDGSSASYGTPGLYYGLAVKSNGDGTYTAYAAEGTNGEIAVIKISSTGTLTQTGQINMQNGDNPAGLSLDSNGLLYVANNVNTASASAEALTPGSLVIYNPAAPKVVTNKSTSTTQTAAPEVARIILNTKAFGTYQVPSNSTFRPGPLRPFTPTSFPYAVQALPDGSQVYISSQRDGLVYSVKPATQAVTTITTGVNTPNSHPIAFALNGTTLYVANAQDDSVSVINTATDEVINTISLTSLLPVGLAGATPNALALSPDSNTLYVTLADMNAVAVVNIATSATASVTGYIPTGWYPTGIAVVNNGNSPSGTNLLVANAKGTSQANPNPAHVVHNPPPGNSTKYTATTSPANPYPNLSDPYVAANDTYNDTFYDENVLEGNVQDIALPDANLTTDTATVVANNTNATDAGAATLAALGLAGTGTIKHVIYIVKENRTYDQVLGDLPGGNGDASLAIFGRTVTPNLHALATQYALLDNFYDCAEVSGDGWNWSTQSYANEYVIKNVPNNYSYRRASYDFEGQVNNVLVGGVPKGTFSSKVFPNGTPAFPDVDTGVGGYIWDAVEKAGLTFRNYGFLIDSGVSNLSPDNYPSEPGLQPGDHYTGGDTYGHTDLDFREFDLNYPDSDAPVGSGDPYSEKTYGQFSEPDRFAEWNREFQAMLAAAPDGAAVPNLETIKFMSDHTNGFSVGGVTPVAHVADNDYAVAELVNAIGNSPIRDSTVIFVIEDDAQDGPDHVDCHRSTAYVISPYIPQGTVDHGFHNTDSVLHSIELLLDLPPLTQYDAYAPSFGSDFVKTPVNDAVYAPIAETQATQVRTASWFKAHPAYMKLVAMTSKMDFRKEDRAPAQLLNEVIWMSVKGMNAAMPVPQHHVVRVQAVKGTVKGAKATVRDNDDN